MLVSAVRRVRGPHLDRLYPPGRRPRVHLHGTRHRRDLQPVSTAPRPSVGLSTRGDDLVFRIPGAADVACLTRVTQLADQTSMSRSGPERRLGDVRRGAASLESNSSSSYVESRTTTGPSGFAVSLPPIDAAIPGRLTSISTRPGCTCRRRPATPRPTSSPRPSRIRRSRRPRLRGRAGRQLVVDDEHPDVRHEHLLRTSCPFRASGRHGATRRAGVRLTTRSVDETPLEHSSERGSTCGR